MNVRKMTLCALFAALMAVCAWISIPIAPLSFTMQTFAVLTSLGILGGKWGSRSILLYLALGFLGLPVFSGFRGGMAALLDTTGGFLWGFGAGGLAYWAVQQLGRLPGMILCQLICYACGCLWFSLWAGCGMDTAILTCVVPYLIPDGVKLWLAYLLSKRMARQLRK